MTEAAERPRNEVQRYLPALDGLRGFLMLFVALRHFNTFWRPVTLPEYIYFGFLHLSISALDVFFALSGYLICGILLDTKGREHYFGNFYLRRALRIFPVYYIFLVLWFNVAPALAPGDVNTIHQPLSTQAWYYAYLTNFMAVVKGYDFVPKGTYHLWSLAVEEQFYLLWPAVVYLCSRRTLVRVTIGCMVFSLLFRAAVMLLHLDYQVGFVLLPGRMDPLAAGCLLAILLREPGWRERLTRWMRPAWILSMAVVTGTVAVTGKFLPDNPFVATVGLTASAFLAMSSIMIVLSLTPGSLLHRVLANRVSVAVGGLTYAWYIFHWAVMVLCGINGFTIASFAGILPNRITSQLAYSASLTLITLAVATISWNLMEKHAVKLKKLFPYGPVRQEKPS